MRGFKHSGFDWIGEIPISWRVGKAKHAFIRKNAKAMQEDPVILSLARSGVRVRDISTNEGQIAESYFNYNPVEPGDFLLNPMDLYSGANCSMSQVSGVISPAYINLRAKKGFVAEYYDFYFKTQYWAMALFAHGKGVSFDNRWTLNADTLFNYAIPIPPVEEQERIASYLTKKAAAMGYDDVKPMVAFSGEVTLNDETYTESGLNVRPDGSHIADTQTKQEFHDNFNILIVAEKYQTGFDEPLLHTMIVDKKLRNVKTVQTLSRLNRTCSGKNDTYVLDFANTAEDVQADFQVFYHETMLEEEVNTDLLYKVQKELRGFRIYDDQDIANFCEVYFAKGVQSTEAQGILVSKLVPAVQRYQEKAKDDQYQIRRVMRNFCKWYKYVSQVVRMFDKELHREFVYCSFLVGLLPAEVVVMDNIAKLLTLEMYKLEKTFDGDISLSHESGIYTPAEPKGAGKPEDKDPLDEIIARINEKYKGEFTDADRVMIGALAERLRSDTRLANMALSSDPQIFAESIFPQAFNIAAQDSYIESQETYTSLFEDRSKYNAIMHTLAEMLYREMRQPGDKK